MSPEMIVGLISTLPNLAGLLLLAWSQNRVIDRLFKENERTEKQVNNYGERIAELETEVEVLIKTTKITETTMHDLLLITLKIPEK